MQSPVPLQPEPLQPAKVAPVAALAVSVTGVPSTKSAEHDPPQVIPAGEEVTAPAPAPDFDTASRRIVGAVKVAVNVRMTTSMPPLAVPPLSWMRTVIVELPAEPGV
jgi:hypothetical protein